MLTFTFDDGHNSVLTNAETILNKYGFVATVGLVLEKAVWRNRRRFISIDEAMLLQEKGWEIASHSCYHRHARKLPASLRKEDVFEWRRQSNGIYVADYPWEHIYGVIDEGKIFREVSDQEVLRKTKSSFFHDVDRKKVYAHTAEIGDGATANLRVGSFERELRDSRFWLEYYGFKVRSFLVPFSTWPRPFPGVAVRYYSCAATGGKGRNASGNDPMKISRLSMRLEQDVRVILDGISQAIDNGEWVVLLFHRILGEDEGNLKYFDWTIEMFRELVSWVDRSGVAVEPLAKAAESFLGELCEPGAISADDEPAIAGPVGVY